MQAQNPAVKLSLTEINLADSRENGLDSINLENLQNRGDWSPVYQPTTVKVEYKHGRGLSRYKPSLKHLLPIRVKSGPESDMPVDHSGIFSFSFFSWMTPLIWKAFKKNIDEQDLYECSPFDSAYVNGIRLSTLWKLRKSKDCSSKTPVSFTSLLFTFISTRFYTSTILYLLCLFFGFIGPTLFLRSLLEFVQKTDNETYWEGLLWIGGLLLCEAARTLFFMLLWAINLRTSIRATAGIMTCLYNKLLTLHPGTHNKAQGELLNLFSNDCQRIYSMISNAPLIIGGPILILASLVFNWHLIGPFSLITVLVFLLFYLLQSGITKLSLKFRKQTVLYTDERIKLMTEFLTYIKLIKLHAWEKPLSETLSDIRASEHSMLEKCQYLETFSMSLAIMTPYIANIFTILVYTMAGYTLSVADAFTLVVINFIATHGIRTLPLLIKNMVNGKVALNRIEEVLNLNEKERYVTLPLNPDLAVNMQNATLAWTSEVNMEPSSAVEIEHPSGAGDEVATLLKPITLPGPVLTKITMSILRGQLIGIYGSVGSGKSSLLSAILSQMHLLSGQVCVRGSCALVSQQPWVFNGSLKENIVFDHPFNSKKYYESIYCCGLTETVAALPKGDETKIGDRGLTLSGGQKQRLCLARALYSDREIYLLDDPFSALDSKMQHFVLHHCIKGALRDKTIFLVTSNPMFLHECNQIILMREGQILDSGTHETLMASNQEYCTLLQEHGNSLEEENSLLNESMEFVSPERSIANGSSSKDGLPPTHNETVASGNISSDTYQIYLQMTGGYIVCFLVIFWYIIQGSLAIFSNWWLSYWLKHQGGIPINSTVNDGINITEVYYEEPSLSSESNMDMYQLVYGLSALFLVLSSLIAGYLFTKASYRASSSLHNTLFKKIINSPMCFFDLIPMGQIMNLFTRDMDEVDSHLPHLVDSFLQRITIVILNFLVVALVFNYFIIPLIIIAVIFIILHRFFRVATRDLKRLENKRRSPIYSLILESLQGLPSIQAFQRQEEFKRRFTDTVDQHSSPHYLYQSSLRWMTARMDILCVLLTTIISLFAIFFKNAENASLAALAIAIGMQITSQFHLVMRLAVDVETRFTSVERIHSYIEELETEPKGTVTPPPEWPTRGRIKFTDVNMRYRPALPLALKGVSFEIGAQSKIAIVGQTGAGKSSIGAALFRLVELSSGTITLDDIDISNLNVEQLRSKMSIIPQDPVLFQGSIRYNLDPLQQYEDKELWDTLEQTHMKEKVSSLDLLVREGGENFSVGEKQLLCMARALLSRTKVVLLDEATASIDPETDALLQKTIEEVFEDFTVLTIAHRLSTVKYYPKVLVLQDGKVVEFDSFERLSNNKDSVFSTLMVEKSA